MDTTSQAFRKAFPAFMDPSCFPDHEYDWWHQLGEKLVSKCAWGELYGDGLFLFIAHNLALEFASTKAGQSGKAPGAVQGITTSASVDKVSYSRDASSAMDPAAGHWNLTIYGLRYRRLVLMIGARPLQVGPHNMAPVGQYWPGVLPDPHG